MAERKIQVQDRRILTDSAYHNSSQLPVGEPLRAWEDKRGKAGQKGSGLRILVLTI